VFDYYRKIIFYLMCTICFPSFDFILVVDSIRQEFVLSVSLLHACSYAKRGLRFSLLLSIFCRL
jgi:hypothetical protein